MNNINSPWGLQFLTPSNFYTLIFLLQTLYNLSNKILTYTHIEGADQKKFHSNISPSCTDVDTLYLNEERLGCYKNNIKRVILYF